MGKLTRGPLIEAGLWLGLALFLFAFSFEINKSIEIYKFGASGWPRVVIALIAIGALPFVFVCVLLCVCLVRGLRQEVQNADR